MLDFTSALYLGLRHASVSLRPWAQLTDGVPYALNTPPLSHAVAGRLAELIGVERATLARSTLHAFWDLFVILAGADAAIYVDAIAYPVARWGIERAAGLGVPAYGFARHDPDDLRRRLSMSVGYRRRPIVVTDGLTPGCGGTAPLPRYREITREFGGMLVIDDTQALGILGRAPNPRAPYGVGGGGSLRHHGVNGPDVLIVASLAKGFGVPMTVLAGSAARISHFDRESGTRVHCSPPSAADLSAAACAIDINRDAGERLRLRLALLVRRFRDGVQRLGVEMPRTLFPVQRLVLPTPEEAPAVHQRLRLMGVHALLQRPSCRRSPNLAFLITARHAPAAIDRAVEAVGLALRRERHGRPSMNALRRSLTYDHR